MNSSNRFKKISAVLAVVCLLLAGFGVWLFMSTPDNPVARGSIAAGVYNTDGGDKLVAQSGGEIEIQSGATLDVQSGATAGFGNDVTFTGQLTPNGILSTYNKENIGLPTVLKVEIEY